MLLIKDEKDARSAGRDGTDDRYSNDLTETNDICTSWTGHLSANETPRTRGSCKITELPVKYCSTDGFTIHEHFIGSTESMRKWTQKPATRRIWTSRKTPRTTGNYW